MLKILYFSTPWCQPCKAMAPVIAEMQAIVPIEKINAEQDPMLAQTHSVRSVPTFIFMKDGVEVGRRTGAMSKQEFVVLCQQYS